MVKKVSVFVAFKSASAILTTVQHVTLCNNVDVPNKEIVPTN